MTTYRMTIYEGNEKTVDECSDEDDLRDMVDMALKDIEAKTIKTFTVSWISEKRFTPEKPFWEK